jgi:hypothetical protein
LLRLFLFYILYIKYDIKQTSKMEEFSYLFALIVILLLVWVFYSGPKVVYVPINWGKRKMAAMTTAAPAATISVPAPVAAAVAAPAAPSAEHMIASNTIMRLSRGYNGMNTGSSYADAMNTLTEAEKMSLASVETDSRSMASPRGEPGM